MSTGNFHYLCEPPAARGPRPVILINRMPCESPGAGNHGKQHLYPLLIADARECCILLYKAFIQIWEV